VFPTKRGYVGEKFGGETEDFHQKKIWGVIKRKKGFFWGGVLTGAQKGGPRVFSTEKGGAQSFF